MTEKVLYKSLRIGKGPTQIVPTVQYLAEDDNLNNGTGRLTYVKFELKCTKSLVPRWLANTPPIVPSKTSKL